MDVRTTRAFATSVFACVAVGLSAAASAADIVDPTQPPPGYGAFQRPGDPQSAASIPAPEPVHLQMIARDGSARMAIVNGYRVRAGDAMTLDGKSVKVVSIQDDSIVLEREGRRQILELTPRVRLK